MKKIIVFVMLVLAALLLFPRLTLASDVGQEKEFGRRFTMKHYIGTGLFIPKEGDIDIGPSAVFGVSMKNAADNESAFVDIAFSKSDLSGSVLWTRGDARQMVVRLGYKRTITKSHKWKLGADIQTHQIDFGTRKMTRLTYGILAEYSFSKRWSSQFESAHRVSNSNLDFGAFHLMLLREF